MPPRSSKQQLPPALGEARRSQVLQLYGPGAMVDLPDMAVLIGGLDYWNKRGSEPIHEPRLQQLVRQATGVAQLELRTPPCKQDGLQNADGSIKALRFPEWSLVQKKIPDRVANGIVCRARRLVHYNDGCIQNWTRYRDDDGVFPLVPVRFVMACPHGHLSDIRWRDFCFRQSNCTNQEPLYLLEAGTGNDFTQIFVQSENGQTRKLADALIPEMRALGTCRAHTPWLGRYRRDEEECKTKGELTANRLLVRSATNAYFSETISVISLPEGANSLSKRVAEQYDNLRLFTDKSQIEVALQAFPTVKAAFDGVNAADLWDAIQAHRGEAPGSPNVEPKDEELRLLTGPIEAGSLSTENSTFDAEVWTPAYAPDWYGKALRRVLLVKRLREVQALVGFTRFTARTSSLGGLPIDTSQGSRRASLARDLRWVPACENKGEGIFLDFEPNTLKNWAASASVVARTTQFTKAFENDWLQSRSLDQEQFPFPGAPYLLLHSLSHLLITEIALECGYGVSAIRERIYCNPEIGYGILLYTSSSGSEGTLGGLVDAGSRILDYLERAFERAQLCSNDPFCSEHDPNHPYDIRPTHGAACHGCELIAETSCERGNEFLDRALVSPTVILPPTGDPSFWGYLHSAESN